MDIIRFLYVKVEDFNSTYNEDGIAKTHTSFNNISVNQQSVLASFDPGVVVFPKRGAAIFKNRAKILKKKGSVDPNLMVAESFLLCPDILAAYFVYIDLSNICDNSGVPQINNKHLYPLLFPVPSRREQEKILERIKSLEDKIRAEDQNLQKLQKQKSGLMHDLLTGKVPVQVEPEAETEAAHV